MRIDRFEFNLFGENTYVVWDEASKEAAVIDPGMQTPSEQITIKSFIESNGLKVRHLLNTHLHIDHTLGNDFISGTYGVGTEANRQDLPLGRARAEQARMFHLRIPEPQPLDIYKELNDGDTVALGEKLLKVITVPGHSLGSVCFYSPDDKFVITGDALFQGSIGRTDLPGGDYPTLIKSITEKLLCIPDDTIVYPGHGPSTTIGREKHYNPYL